MAKVKSVYTCQNCGYNSPKWLGKCPSCNQWNTLVEEVLDSGNGQPFDWKKGDKEMAARKSKPVQLGEIRESSLRRIDTGDPEFNRVLGGGIVPGSLILLGGEPGIGKSTLMLQSGLGLEGLKVLYISGEESEQQIKLRANRLGVDHEGYFVLTETNTQKIFKHAKGLNPDILIADSVQTLHSNYIDSTPGSVSQIRECTGELQRFAKETGTPVFLVGHITKDGAIAGPKLLEHMVDTVLQFEGERNHQYRILRTVKNRFGSTAELGIYEMGSTGLKPVANPSEVLLSDHETPVSGMAVAAMIEGLRPMLIEVQALVAPSVYGNPQRSATGLDLRRLNMLLAVLEKRCGFQLGNQDIFLNITGGIKVADPAIDLAIVCAVISSLEDIPVPAGTAFTGEIGLSGEIRPVTRIEQRINEAAKLGLETVYISKANMKGMENLKFTPTIYVVSRIEEIYQQLFT